jgi:hypothetical protein
MTGLGSMGCFLGMTSKSVAGRSQVSKQGLIFALPAITNLRFPLPNYMFF